MPNTELPIDLENQVVLMKKYVNFRQRKAYSGEKKVLRFPYKHIYIFKILYPDDRKESAKVCKGSADL